MYPTIDAETVRLVSELRAAVYVGDVPPDRRVTELVARLTPKFQSESVPRFAETDLAGRPIAVIDVATCGACGRSWDDALGSSLTPVPSGRCPFEYEHEDVPPLGDVARIARRLQDMHDEAEARDAYPHRGEFNALAMDLAEQVRGLVDEG